MPLPGAPCVSLLGLLTKHHRRGLKQQELGDSALEAEVQDQGVGRAASASSGAAGKCSCLRLARRRRLHGHVVPSEYMSVSTSLSL